MQKPLMNVEIAGIKMRNPVTTASGTFGSGKEYGKFIDLNRLGAITVKGVSLEPWMGNPVPRIVETPAGILNAIGLQNPGVQAFMRDDMPFLRKYDLPVIVNIVGNSPEEYAGVAGVLDNVEGIAGFEVNISCPNVKRGGIAFGTDPECAADVIRKVKSSTKLPVIAKLSPNVTDVTLIAKKVEEAGADAVSLINTLLGMVIDIKTRKPVLGNIMGGLSGPAVKPVAVRMVWQVAKAVKIPIIGMGGIRTATDALEFIMAGASAVAVGTANFVNPNATMEIIEGLEAFMIENKINDIKELIGAAQRS